MQRAPSAAMLRATLPAPPTVSSLRRTARIGAGASGEMRETSPYTKSSSIKSPTQTMVCSGMSLSASSKLNMELLRLSPIPIGLVQEQGNIAIHPLFERGEAGVVAGPAQVFDLGFREVLVLVADRRGHVDVIDGRLASERPEHCGNQIAEASRLAGADVEDARYRGRPEQPAHHGDRVIDVDEVAFLFAVGDAVAVGFEQAHRLAAFRLVEALGDEAHHFPLVIFVGAEHVEKFEPHPLRRKLRAVHQAIDDREIEEMFAEAVQIHWLEPPQRSERPIVIKARCAIAVSRSRRCIDERGTCRRAPIQKLERKTKIGGEDKVGVSCGGIGHGAEMDDRLKLAAIEPSDELARRHHVSDLPFAEIAPFTLCAERVIDHNVGAPGLVEAGDQIGPDEAGSAGDQQHSYPPRLLPPFARGRPRVQLPWADSVKGGLSLSDALRPLDSHQAAS